MNVLAAFSLIFIAGIINGSFALPTKYIDKWKFENIWLQYAIWAFVILPWVAALIFVPQIVAVYMQAPWELLLIMLAGGLVFGIGQMCFALALDMIGFGVGFVINLGLGIMLGFSLPLIIQHSDQLFTPFGFMTLIGCVLAVLGLIYSTLAGNKHNFEQNQEHLSSGSKPKKLFALGVTLAIVAGLSSAGQNFAFSLTAQMQTMALQQGATEFGAANVMWPGFLLCGFVPYALYMLFLGAKNKSFGNFTKSGTGKYYLFALIMGLFWYGSLIFYGKASQIIGNLGPIVGWPLFMVLIILASNFWGWRHGEWKGASAGVKKTLWIGLTLLVLAVVVLGYSAGMHA
jgi:L-rhamnose-H+ transport protein